MIFKSIENLASQAKMYTKSVENVIAMKGLNNLLLDGRTVENKGKVILTSNGPRGALWSHSILLFLPKDLFPINTRVV